METGFWVILKEKKQEAVKQLTVVLAQEKTISYLYQKQKPYVRTNDWHYAY